MTAVELLAQAAEMSRSHREPIYHKGRAGDQTMCSCLCWQNTFTYKDLPKKKAIFGWTTGEQTIAGAQEERAINTVEAKAHLNGTAAAREHSKDGNQRPSQRRKKN